VSRVRSESRLLQARLAVQQAASKHVQGRAQLLSGIAKELHKNAPRGGENRNRFGERRSAPGEPPAMETGKLFADLDQGVTQQGMRAEVIVADKHLENGTRRGLKPRPLGRLALAELKARVP
jgi:hypothetical protein